MRMAQASLPSGSFYQNSYIIENWFNNAPEFLEIKDYRNLRMVWGHSVHEQMLRYLENPILITGLRDPLKRLQSAAAYELRLRRTQRRVGVDISRWVADQRDGMCWFIINRFPTFAKPHLGGTVFEQAQRALRHFTYVYFTESFSETAPRVFALLGLSMPNVETANASTDDALPEIESPDDLLQNDRKLYAWAKEYFDTAREFEATEELRGFCSSLPEDNVLSDFLLRNQFGEYKDWGRLDEVIARKSQLAKRLVDEIAFYTAQKYKRQLT
jgi:hypothetical protein